MKRISRIVASVLSLVLMFTSISIVGVSAEETLDFTYKVTYSLELGESCVEIKDYTGTDPNPVVPEYIEGYPVRMIYFAFQNKAHVETVDLPDTLARISSDAFIGTALYDNPENWENNAFYVDNCLIKVKPEYEGKFSVKDGTRVISNCAFRDCDKITEVTMTDSVEYIGVAPFDWCDELKSVRLSEKITILPFDLLCGCPKIESLHISKNVERIDSWIVSVCPSFKEFIVDDDNPLFYDMDGVLFGREHSVLISYPPAKPDTHYTVPDGITQAYYGFKDNPYLKTVTLSSQYDYIYKLEFDGSYNLTDINVPEDNPYFKSIDGIVYTKDETELMVCPSGKTGAINNISKKTQKLHDGAFWDCIYISEVNIPYGVKTLGDELFNDCAALESLYIPETVVEVEDDIFNNDCDSLSAITFGGTEEAWKALKIHIPYMANPKMTFLGKVPLAYELGDVDCDGEISVLDATEIQLYIASKKDINNNALSVADADKDGVISILDATQLQMFVAQLIPEL